MEAEGSGTAYRYAIHVRGHLDARCAVWLDGGTITHEQGGMTRIERAIADRAAFHGVLTKLRILGLWIIAVQRLAPVPP